MQKMHLNCAIFKAISFLEMLWLIIKPLVVLADVGLVVDFGTGFIAFLLGFSLWLIVTAIS